MSTRAGMFMLPPVSNQLLHVLLDMRARARHCAMKKRGKEIEWFSCPDSSLEYELGLPRHQIKRYMGDLSRRGIISTRRRKKIGGRRLVRINWHPLEEMAERLKHIQMLFHKDPAAYLDAMKEIRRERRLTRGNDDL